MAYTNNVPQANQRIAATTVPIQQNFAFIQSDLQVEHQFNGNIPGQAEGTHIKTSMPNIADPVALPAGTNGIYYISGSLPKFYNGVAVFLPFATCSSFTASGGPITLNTTPTLITAIPDNSCGTYFIIRTSSSATYAIGTFNSAGGQLVLHQDHNTNISAVSSGLNLFAITSGGTFNSIKWVVQINTP